MMRHGMAGGGLYMGPQRGRVPSCKGQAEEPHGQGLGIGASVGAPAAPRCLCPALAGTAQGPQTHLPKPPTLQGESKRCAPPTCTM